MISAFSNKLKRYANGWIILAFFLIILVFAIGIVPSLQHQLEALSGGSGPLDLLFSYSPEKAYSVISAFGEQGRSLYRTFAMTADIIYPVIYSIFFGLVITWLFQRSFPANSKLHLLNVVPFGALLFDWLENINLITLLTQYPSQLPTIVTLASLSTSIKWCFGITAILLVLVGLVLAIKNRFREQSI